MKKFCPLRGFFMWLKKATGIGYNPMALKTNGKELQKKANQVCRQVELLERELRSGKF